MFWVGESLDQVKNSITSIKELEKSCNLFFLNQSLTSDPEGSSCLLLTNASNLAENFVDENDKWNDDEESLVHSRPQKRLRRILKSM
jgi:hypothetical protein